MGFENFLKYGITGFAAILAILSFRLLVRELKRETIRALALISIVVFMVFSCVLALMTQVPSTTVEAWLAPDPEKVCKEQINKIATLEQQVEQLSCVRVDGKIIDPPDPAHLNVVAIRQWKMYPPGGDGKLRQKFRQDAAPIVLLIRSGEYGELRTVNEDDVKNGCYNAGEITLKKGLDPWATVFAGEWPR
jgi:hypothetical protein